MIGVTIEEMSELSKKVSNTMDEFRNQANQGMLTRDYQDAQEVIKICAGCGGIIHGKEYWYEAEYKNLAGETTKCYKLTSEWRNQFKMAPVFMSTAGSNMALKRAIRCLNKYVDSKYCWAVFFRCSFYDKTNPAPAKRIRLDDTPGRGKIQSEYGLHLHQLCTKTRSSGVKRLGYHNLWNRCRSIYRQAHQDC